MSVILMILSAVFLTGCAEMITGPKPLAGNTLFFEVNFAEKYDSASYKYYFIYSKKDINFALNYYLFVPGDSHVYNIDENTILPSTLTANVDNVLDFYYQNYFSTWSDALKMDSTMQPNTMLIVYDSLNYFPSSASTTTHDQYVAIEPSSYLVQDGSASYLNGFSVQINFSQLKNAPNVGDTFYFDLLVLDQSNKLIESVGGQIINQLGNESGDDGGNEDQEINGNLDVLNWRLTIL